MDKPMLISFSPEINSVNDHTAFIQRANEIRRVGWWGRSDKFGRDGYSFGASYAPLATAICLFFGIRAYLWFAVACYAAMFALFTPPWMMPLCLPVALLSPWFKNSAFIAGRMDLAGWPLLISGLYLTATGSAGWAVIPCAAALAIHPSCGVVGLAGLAALWATGAAGWRDAGMVATAMVMWNVWWLIPFFKAGPGLRHSWTPGTARDLTRGWRVNLHKAAGMILFLGVLWFSR